MNRFNDTHPQKATDHTVLMVYNTSIDTKIFTFQLPGWCAMLLIMRRKFHQVVAFFEVNEIVLWADSWRIVSVLRAGRGRGWYVACGVLGAWPLF